MWQRCALVTCSLACLLLEACLQVSLAADVITNQWHVKVQGGERVAREVARTNGFSFVSQVLDHPLEFHFVHNGIPRIRARRSLAHLRMLKQDPNVLHAEQLAGYGREKRGYKQYSPAQPETETKAKEQKDPQDPLYKHEWYLHNDGQAGGVLHLDLNVNEAWDKGITGKGVTTAIMDDGIDYMHPDLSNNFNAKASFDYSSNDPFPYPRYTDDWFNSHGTRCAGEIAAARDNHICGVGVAYGSKVAGLRMLDQPYMTDLIEANSMSHEPDIIDIYSASWGPTDDGRTVDGPRNATMRAIVNGVNKGRNGKGNIYVWASGDGGPLDDCNCDGYAASMWTISINSATNDGSVASYDESCSSTLGSTFSNGKQMFADAGVATTDLYGNCTLRHSGTSAAAPEAAGVFALALEANPQLTWRDIQHLVVLTSKRRHLEDPHRKHSWQENGAKLLFNHLFGYGVLDAGSMVDLAQRWHNVPERYHCTAGTINGTYHFVEGESLVLKIDTEACAGQDNEVNFLEHVQAFITVRASRRGDVTIYLTSPMNTTSMLLSRRPKDDDSREGFVKWPFMTTQSWAEQPRGLWVLEVRFDREAKSWYGDTGAENDEQARREGVLLDWSLVLHGTRSAPYQGIEDPDGRHVKLNVVRREHNNAYFKAH